MNFVTPPARILNFSNQPSVSTMMIAIPKTETAWLESFHQSLVDFAEDNFTAGAMHSPYFDWRVIPGTHLSDEWLHDYVLLMVETVDCYRSSLVRVRGLIEKKNNTSLSLRALYVEDSKE